MEKPGSTSPPTSISMSYPSASMVKKWGTVLRLLELVSPSGNTMVSPALTISTMSQQATGSRTSSVAVPWASGCAES